LFLAGEAAHPALLPLAVSYLALVAREGDAAEAARLIAYADARRRISGHELAEMERGTFDELRTALKGALGEAEWSSATAEGQLWSHEQAYARAKRF
jgi:hypothetical protein